MALDEINEASGLVREVVDENCNIIFGTSINENMKDEVEVTIIATGFTGGSFEQKPEAPTTPYGKFFGKDAIQTDQPQNPFGNQQGQPQPFAQTPFGAKIQRPNLYAQNQGQPQPQGYVQPQQPFAPQPQPQPFAGQQYQPQQTQLWQ